MTFKEKWLQDHPGEEFSLTGHGTASWRCPYKCGYEKVDADSAHCEMGCTACCNREMPGVEEKPRILDSGERQQFETGAVRDIQEGKGRPDLMPLRVLAYIWRTIDPDYDDKGVDKARVFEWIADFMDTGDTKNLIFAINSFTGYLDWPTAFLEVSKHFEEGAKKYGENNWQKGLPVNCYINSALRHYLKWLRGDTDEPHDRAFVWNLLCCIWEVDFSPRAKKRAEVPFMKKHIAHGYIPVVDSDSLPDLRPVGEKVSLEDCPIGPFDFNGVLGLKTEYANEVYTIVGGEHMSVNDSDMVQPLEVI